MESSMESSTRATSMCPRCRQFEIVCLCPRSFSYPNEQWREERRMTTHSISRRASHVVHKKDDNNDNDNDNDNDKDKDNYRTCDESPSNVCRDTLSKGANALMRELGRLDHQLDHDEDYVGHEPSQRNWKGIVISLLVITSVIALVALSVVLVTPSDPGPRIRGRRLALDDVVNERFRPRSFDGHWISDNEILHRDHENGLSVLNVLDKTHSYTLMTNSTFRQLDSSEYWVSSDLSFVLLSFSFEKLFRHSARRQLALFSVKEGVRTVLSLKDEQTFFSLAKWGNKANMLALVEAESNDIYVMRDADKSDNFTRITYTGKKGIIFNGVPDWLYEEEVLASNDALWFSPSDQRLLYATFDDSDVGQINMEHFGNEDFDSDSDSLSQYPSIQSLRYPRAGTDNPKVSLHVVNLHGEDDEQVSLTPPPNIGAVEHYLLNARWLNDDVVAVTWTNRPQNLSVVSVCVQPDFACRLVYEEQARSGWLLSPPVDPAIFSSSMDSMITISYVRDAANTFYPQIVRVNIDWRELKSKNNDNSHLRDKVVTEPQSLTQGRFHVTRILGWDQPRGLIYFMSTLPGSPGVRHLQVVSDTVDASNLFAPQITCLTCNNNNKDNKDNNNKDNNNNNNKDKDNNDNDNDNDNDNNNKDNKGSDYCGYNDISLSSEFSHMVRRCQGPSVPFADVHDLNGRESRLLFALESNEDLKMDLAKHSLPTIQDFEVDLEGQIEDPLRARVRLILPPGLREDEAFTFPLVVNVYGGPGSQAVSERWSLDFDWYLASGRDMVVAHMDVRGSGFSQPSFRDAVFHKLGHLEAIDTLTVIRNLTHLHYIDQEKVAIWGWSYGGFLALRAVAEDSDHMIACTTAVAPVTQWTLYDSAYTERFMGHPYDQRHWKSYEEADLTLQAARFLDRKLMLMHGTADDNVHLQHTLALSKALTNHHVLFTQQIYPDESHGLEGVRRHQYCTLERFFDNCLGPLPDYFSDLVTPSSGFDQLQQLFGIPDSQEKKENNH